LPGGCGRSAKPNAPEVVVEGRSDHPCLRQDLVDGQLTEVVLAQELLGSIENLPLSFLGFAPDPSPPR